MNQTYGQRGELIGNCQLVQPLRVRAHAEIWYAAYGQPARAVVVKLLRPEHPRRHEFRQIAEKIQPLTTIPQLVKVVECGKTVSGAVFAAMEYFPGGTLRQYLQTYGCLSSAQAVYVLGEVLQALVLMHEQKIVHRDIKPENIYLAPHRVGVGDWGIAKIPEIAEVNARVWGTAVYMSPEQLQDSSQVDERADFFSLAAVIYEALCGRRCYEGNSFRAVLKAQNATDTNLIGAQLRQVAPCALVRLLEQMLEKNRALRPRCATEILQKLHQLPLTPAPLVENESAEE